MTDERHGNPGPSPGPNSGQNPGQTRFIGAVAADSPQVPEKPCLTRVLVSGVNPCLTRVFGLHSVLGLGVLGEL